MDDSGYSVEAVRQEIKRETNAVFFLVHLREGHFIKSKPTDGVLEKKKSVQGDAKFRRPRYKGRNNISQSICVAASKDSRSVMAMASERPPREMFALLAIIPTLSVFRQTGSCSDQCSGYCVVVPP